MQKVIIHTATRVIRRLTTDENPVVLSDESIIPMNPSIVLDGFKKLALDNISLLVPTQQEIDDSGVDESRNALIRQQKMNQVKAAIDDIALNGATLSRIRAYFQALRNAS